MLLVVFLSDEIHKVKMWEKNGTKGRGKKEEKLKEKEKRRKRGKEGKIKDFFSKTFICTFI